MQISTMLIRTNTIIMQHLHDRFQSELIAKKIKKNVATLPVQFDSNTL